MIMLLPSLPEILDQKIEDRFRGTPMAFPVGGYIGSRRESINLNPPYQRPDVWTLEQRRLLIRALMYGVPVPALILNEKSIGTDGSLNVIDGKQRLTSVFMFVDGEIDVDGIYYSGLCARDKMAFEYASLPCILCRFKDEAEEERYYELFNYAGTAHPQLAKQFSK